MGQDAALGRNLISLLDIHKGPHHPLEVIHIILHGIDTKDGIPASKRKTLLKGG